MCPACGVARSARMLCCASCARSLAPGGERRLDGGLLVAAAYLHEGAARLLVHRLKYGALPAAAVPLARAMAPAVADAPVLVPVPRAVLRRWRHGVDPARELARAVAILTGIPVVDALAPGWWYPARAGAANRRRGVPRLRCRRSVPDGAVLLDDVLTTGATLGAAAAALGSTRVRAVVATASPGRARPVPVVSDQQPLRGHSSTGDCVSSSDRTDKSPPLTAAAP